MKKIILLALTLVACNGFASEVSCILKLNQSPISQIKVSTFKNERINIDSFNGIDAYITENAQNKFIVEAYLEDYDLRIYGEGVLRQKGDKLVASAWGRSSQVDVECLLLN